jgi:hypothetical protein
MSTMDFGIPDLSPGRDAVVDPARRRDKAGSSDFSAMLDRTLDSSEEPPREHAPAKTAEPAAGEKVREKPQRPDHAERERPQADSEAEAPATGETAAQDPSAQAASEPQKPTAESASPDSQDVAAADNAATAANEIPPAAPAAPQVMPTQPASLAAAKTPQTPTVDPAAPLAAAAQPVPADAGTIEFPKTPDASAASQPDFAAQLVSANGKPAEAAPAKPKAKSDAAPAETVVKPAVVDTAIAAAVSAATATTSDNGPQRDASNGNPAPHSPVTPPAATPAQVAPSATTQPPAMAVAAQAAPATDASSDDEQIVAIVRAPVQQTAAPARPATTEPTAPPPALDSLPKEIGSDAKAVAEPAKTETPRPFGALAPGLGVAAQITAQQTPDQANAAERLAQLVAAAEETVPAATVDAEPTDAKSEAAPALRTEQPASVDAPVSRQAATDVTAANATARTARPTYHPVVTQVAAQMAQAAADGSDRINIRLSPVELGRIDVKLDFGPDGRIQAVFAAERPQTMELLQRDARDLERALQDAGLRADSGSLSFNLRGNGRENRDGHPSSGGRNDGAPSDVAASQLQAYSAGSGGSGRLDIRI